MKNKCLKRGNSSEHSGTHGKGHSGQKVRSGGIRIGFEGGQTTTIIKTPKLKGGSTGTRPSPSFLILKLQDLEVKNETKSKSFSLEYNQKSQKIERKYRKPLKVLDGEISTSVLIKARSFSVSVSVTNRVLKKANNKSYFNI